MLHSGLQDNTLHKVFYKILNWVIHFNEIWRILRHIKIFEEIYIIFLSIYGEIVYSLSLIYTLYPQWSIYETPCILSLWSIYLKYPVSSVIYIFSHPVSSVIHIFGTICVPSDPLEHHIIFFVIHISGTPCFHSDPLGQLHPL